ncbi:MAG: TrkH family potassium uptake protein [Candidatus Hydrogenedens sp.]|jgi:trk system potassium uptake protein TrkH|nr:TrkH family potassium uptake protein [Candidatus Hydrogenedens sp.]
MNYRALIKNLGLFCLTAAGMFIPACICAVVYGETRILLSFLLSMVISLLVGTLFFALGRKSNDRLYQRETLALVGLGWLLAALLGGLPYFLGGALSFENACFESMSGFTTTGATILSNIDQLPRSLLFWRALTHWLGGLGIVLLILIVLPFLGAGGKLLYRSEVPGIVKSDLRPRIKDSALSLLKLYGGMTLVMTVILYLLGMGLFDAVTHTFGALSTGGFSPHQASVAQFNSISIELVIIGFMLISATHFGLLHQILRRQYKKAFSNPEWRLFLTIVIAATLLICANLYQAELKGQTIIRTENHTPLPPGLELFRMSFFQVVSIMTTTGFCTEDFNLWPSFSQGILIVLMFVGGCSGSTAGGLKVIRFLLFLKMAYWQIEKSFKPKNVHALIVDDTVIQPEMQQAIFTFFFIYMAIAGLSTLFLSGLGLSLVTSFSAVAACLNNVGPGLDLVGVTANYDFLPFSAKGLLFFLMAMGRLELYAILVLFVPSFWKSS